MRHPFSHTVSDELRQLTDAGLNKTERPLQGPQSARISIRSREFINLSANNYLGLANDESVIEAAKEALDRYGYGMSSVRFICGTHKLHIELEEALAKFLGKEDAILFAACFDANGCLFEALLRAEDSIVSDALNHASIVDGIRLSRANRYIFPNRDMDCLVQRLREARMAGARHVMIASDGVFSMDGTFAPLDEITALAKEFDAVVVIDGCHATGFVGATGRGMHEHFDVMDDTHILTGTLGKALGGGLGGYIAGTKQVIELLRERARPYLFSNALPPAICSASLRALDLIQQRQDSRQKLFENTVFWREGLHRAGFEVAGKEHPITPVNLGDAKRVQEFSSRLFERGVHAPGFSLIQIAGNNRTRSGW
ncbi:glycine C-acetyltransferase [uncultured Ruegeria sp.]|uniref:glycine C-acetyltransferase n=1 Tax=uncultured Ruegeria sp. TaxID=259304 RepID=UPI002624630B|nr:glycine C-acetyltransferase [uncultured Ruegeria sp.]